MKRYQIDLDPLELGLLIGLLKGFAPGDPIGIHLAHRLVEVAGQVYSDDKYDPEKMASAEASER